MVETYQSQLQNAQQQIQQRQQQLESSRGLRSFGGVAGLLSRQRQSVQLSSAQSEVNQRMNEFLEVQKQQVELERQQQEAINKQLAKQKALEILVTKGKGSDALYSLSPKERTEIRDLASELKRQRQQRIISSAEQQLSSSLNPELRAEIVKKAEFSAKMGGASFSLPNLDARGYEKLIESRKNNLQFQTLSTGLAEPIRRQTQTFGPIQPEYYTPAPPRISPVEAYNQAKTRAITSFLSSPERGFQTVISKAGDIVSAPPKIQYIITDMGDVRGVASLNPNLQKPSADSKKQFERIVDTGSFFIPILGQARTIGYIGDVAGKALQGDPKKIAEAGLLTAGGLVIKGTRDFIRGNTFAPTYETTFSSIATPKGNVLTLAETQRTSYAPFKSSSRVDTFTTVLGERTFVDDVRYFSEGAGMVRSPQGNVVPFRVTSTGEIQEARPFFGAKYTPENIKVDDLLSKKDIQVGIEIPGSKKTFGKSAMLEGNKINIEATRGLSIPVKEDISLGFGLGSMSGKSKGVTFLERTDDIEDAFTFIRPNSQITKTPFSKTFPSTQIENIINKNFQVTTGIPASTKPSVKVASGILSAVESRKSKSSSSTPFFTGGRQTYQVDYLSDVTRPRFTNLGLGIPRPEAGILPKQRDILIERGFFSFGNLDNIFPRESQNPITRSFESPFFFTIPKVSQGVGLDQPQQLFNPLVNIPSPTFPLGPRQPPRKVPKIFLDLDDDIIRKKTTIVNKVKNIFFAEIRRNKKFRRIGEFGTAEEAFKFGLAGARGTLGATIRVRTSKGFATLPVPEDFYRSRKNPFEIIQKRGRRLSSFGERAEIRRSKIKAVRFFK